MQLARTVLPLEQGDIDLLLHRAQRFA